MLSGIFYGLRISLSVGVASTVITLAIGLVLGLAAAYFGGKVDAVIMRIADIQLSFPAILIALVLLAVLGQGVGKIIAALVTVQWALCARTVRPRRWSSAAANTWRRPRCWRLSQPRIVFRHILPNCLPPLIDGDGAGGPRQLEATLSFLGLGLPITEPSIGLLISNGFQYLLSNVLDQYPGLALLVTIVAINLVADQLRGIMNPRLKR